MDRIRAYIAIYGFCRILFPMCPVWNLCGTPQMWGYQGTTLLYNPIQLRTLRDGDFIQLHVMSL